MMKKTKEEWLAQYQTCCSERDLALLSAAYNVLEKNTIERDDAPWGSDPVISPWMGEKAGIWNWDSAFHAITVSRYDERLAKSCIDSFVKYMLPNGLLPDVVRLSGEVVDNFGKPPVMAWGVLTVFERTRDLEFLRRNYDALTKNVRFLERYRMDRGLFFNSAQKNPYANNSKHPKYESGWDNSPRWDNGIVNLWAIDLNSYMVLCYRSMGKIARYLGEDPLPWLQKEGTLARLIEETLFDESQQAYVDLDRETGEFCKVLTPGSFIPLFVGIASQAHADAMNRLALDPNKFYPGLPSVTYDDPTFSNTYCRGPVWLHVAYFVAKGLWDYGHEKTAMELREFLLDLVYEQLPNGMFENYDLIKRKGGSNPSFSWTASFVIELVLMNTVG